VAFVVIAITAWVNVVGVIWGGSVQGVTTALKASFLALVAALPFIVPLFGGEGIDTENYRSRLTVTQQDSSSDADTASNVSASVSSASNQSGRTTVATFALVLLSVMWAYNGWHGITPIAEELREPQRNIPLALFGGIGLLILLYVSANFAYHGVLSMDEMAIKANQEHVAEVMVDRLMGPIGLKLMSASVMLSVLGAINSNLLLGPRVSFAMGRDDVFFRPLGRVHVNFRTPAAAIVVQALMGMLLIVASAFLVRYIDELKDTSIFDLLTNYVIVSASIFYMLAVLAVIVLRIQHPDWERPYRTLGFPVTPIAYLAFYCVFLFYVYTGEPTEANIGILLTVIGLPVYYAYRAWARRHPEDLHDGQ
jgi:APA family basic amino acid/polyamine antiporter